MAACSVTLAPHSLNSKRAGAGPISDGSIPIGQAVP
jgi:hypothetical protein